MQRGQDGLQRGSGRCLSLLAIQEKYHAPTSSQTCSEFSQKVHSDLGETSLYLCNPEGIQAASPDIYRGVSNRDSKVSISDILLCPTKYTYNSNGTSLLK